MVIWLMMPRFPNFQEVVARDNADLETQFILVEQMGVARVPHRSRFGWLIAHPELVEPTELLRDMGAGVIAAIEV